MDKAEADQEVPISGPDSTETMKIFPSYNNAENSDFRKEEEEGEGLPLRADQSSLIGCRQQRNESEHVY